MLLEMTDEKARHLLALSRELRWAFPSSQGTPIIKGHARSQRVEQAVQERESYADAARVLLENGEEEAAVEITSNAWRLWVVAQDLGGGRTFLAAVLDKGEKKPSRARSLAYGDALLAFRQGRNEESRQRSQAALDTALAVDDREALTLAYLGLSRVAFADCDYAKSLTLAVKSRESAVTWTWLWDKCPYSFMPRRPGSQVTTTRQQRCFSKASSSIGRSETKEWWQWSCKI